MSSVPSAVNSVAVSNMSARRLKLSVNSRMKELPRVVVGRYPKKSTPTTTPGAFGSGKDKAGQAIELSGAYSSRLGIPNTHECINEQR